MILMWWNTRMKAFYRTVTEKIKYRPLQVKMDMFYSIKKSIKISSIKEKKIRVK